MDTEYSKFKHYSTKSKHSGYFFTIDEVLLSQRTSVQQIDYFRNIDVGVVLALDGQIQMTERDEFFYHEMLVHPAMNTHPNPEKVLIIGGGHCGTLNQVVKHACVKEITMVEIDQLVVEGAIQFLPNLALSLDDPRVDLRFEDGFAYLASRVREFDIIIVDSSDPSTITSDSFSGTFYEAASNALAKGGVLVTQGEVPYHPDYNEVHRKILDDLKKHFQFVRFAFFPMPCYATGLFSCVISTNYQDPKHIPTSSIENRIKAIETRFYTPSIHVSSMELPNQIKHLLLH